MVRFESKYAICEPWPVRGVFRKFGDYLEAMGFRPFAYDIESIYFDSRDLTCLKQKEGGAFVKNKFRLRRYPLTGDLFWERKSKIGHTSLKTRVSVEAGGASGLESLALARWGLTRASRIFYHRKGWEHEALGLKINFDSGIRGHNFVNHREFSFPEVIVEFKHRGNAVASGATRARVEYLLSSGVLRKISFSKYMLGFSNERT